MKNFMILHYGFTPPTPEIMEEWNAWFEKITDREVTKGHFPHGREITASGMKELPMAADSITGYTIIKAADIAEAEEIASECPFILGTTVYEIMEG